MLSRLQYCWLATTRNLTVYTVSCIYIESLCVVSRSRGDGWAPRATSITLISPTHTHDQTDDYTTVRHIENGDTGTARERENVDVRQVDDVDLGLFFFVVLSPVISIYNNQVANPELIILSIELEEIAQQTGLFAN